MTPTDLADVSPCPGCGIPVRRFPSGRWWLVEPESSDPWWCPACLRAKIDAACG